MGLVQREIEAAGFTTLSLSNIPDLTVSVGAPRVAGIEYPFGRTVGMPGDREGQTRVLRAALGVLATIDTPGTVRCLPFEWPEPPKRARAHPPVPPPITQYLRQHPLQLKNLLLREPPN